MNFNLLLNALAYTLMCTFNFECQIAQLFTAIDKNGYTELILKEKIVFVFLMLQLYTAVILGTYV